MTDIVDRLRNPPPMSTWGSLMDEAADEIERLRAAHQEIITECGGHTLDNEVAFRVGSIARRALEPKP